ncbi:UNVERIFIED_CONTAM: NAD-dependent epimerase/dehydratase family protein [Halobacillus marinus]
MKQVLVTGAGGYVGCVLVPKLLDKGYSVKAVDRFFFGIEKLAPHENLEIIKEDTRRLSQEHFQGVDAVIDLVAISNDPSGELFQDITYDINHHSRVRTARLAKETGVQRYILPSSCSIYGFQESNERVTEENRTNPLTTYAKANERAEQDILPLADEAFTAVVIRQATLYGKSNRMRFDLAVNGMVYGAWKDNEIPLMRDGSQWRPMLHVQDTADLMCLLLEVESRKINGEIFNAGSEAGNYQLERLASEIAATLPEAIAIQWYGHPDHRSYRVSFEKVKKVLGWEAKWTAADGALEIYQALQANELEKGPDTITLDWYKELMKWHDRLKEIEWNGGLFDIEKEQESPLHI